MTVQKTVPAILDVPLLVLSAPCVPAAIVNGGLRWQDLSDPQACVLVQIALDPTAVRPHLQIDLYWQDQLVATEIVDAGRSSAATVTLRVQRSAILEHADGLHCFYYRVSAASGGGANKSPVATIKVRREVPGGYADIGSEPINGNLCAPTGIAAVIDDDDANRGVVACLAAYQNMSVGDRIELDWGGHRTALPPLLAGDIGKCVSFPIPDAILTGATGQLLVRYCVRDAVNNWSKWSLSAVTVVEVGAAHAAPVTLPTAAAIAGKPIPAVLPSKTAVLPHDHNVPLSYLPRKAFFRPKACEPPQDIKLTARETELLQWSEAGKSSWEISVIVTCSEANINYHFNNIRRKFGVSSRHLAGKMARDLGLL